MPGRGDPRMDDAAGGSDAVGDQQNLSGSALKQVFALPLGAKQAMDKGDDTIKELGDNKRRTHN